MKIPKIKGVVKMGKVWTDSRKADRGAEMEREKGVAKGINSRKSKSKANLEREEAGEPAVYDEEEYKGWNKRIGRRKSRYGDYVHPWLTEQQKLMQEDQSFHALIDPSGELAVPTQRDVAFVSALDALHALYKMHAPFRAETGDYLDYCGACSELGDVPVKHPCSTIRTVDSAIEKGYWL